MAKNMQAYNIFTKNGSTGFLAIRNGRTILATADPSNPSQQWYVYRNSGASTIAVVNKATGEAIKQSNDDQSMTVVPYTNNNDASILWIEQNVGDANGYTSIRKPNNTNQVWDSYGGGINDGNSVRLFPWNATKAQLWNLAPVITIPLPPVAPLVRISSKISTNLFLTIRDGQVVIATKDESNTNQKWYKYDNEDGSSFAMVNYGTGQAIQHPNLEKVRLVDFSDDNNNDSSILWTEHDINDIDGYKAIRIGNSTKSLDVDHSVAQDGTSVLAWEWNKQNNQRWIMQPCASLPPTAPLVRAYCKAGPNWSLTVRNNTVVLAAHNPYDKLQQWYKVDASTKVRENNGNPCFILVNRSTRQVIKVSPGNQQPVQLVFSNNLDDGTTVWSELFLKDGYKSFKCVSDEAMNFDSRNGQVGDGVILQCHTWNGGNGQRWNLAPCAPSPVNGSPIRVFGKDHPYSCITIKDNKVVLAPSDTRDKFQLWYRVDASNQLNQDRSTPFFALVNESTGWAIKHISSNQTVELIRHFSLGDKSTLWIEHSLVDGSKSIRPVDDNSLTLEAASNDLTLTSFSTAKPSQRWIISRSEPITKPLVTGAPATFKVYTKFGSDFVITIRDAKIVLAAFNPYDNLQAWYKETRSKDENGFSYFVLINKGTGLAIKYPTAAGAPLQLVEYKANEVDKSLMWTERSLDDEFVAIGLIDDYSGMTWDSQNTAGASDGVVVGCNKWHGKNNQRWKIALH